MANDETVLVTGGSGFLASWCLYELLRRGYRVRTTVRGRAGEAEVRAALKWGPEPVDDERLTIVTADLTSDDGWPEAVAGCRYVLHVASPFPAREPRDANDLIRPARDGTLRVLRAALDAGVSRMVLTSGSSTVSGMAPSTQSLDEVFWADPTRPGVRPYVRSKAIAERAAWDLIVERDRPDFLTAVLPGTMLGPPRGRHLSYSLQSVAQLVHGTVPGLPRLGFDFVDVRDVADLHLRAMTTPEAGGRRFLGTGEFLWVEDVARILREGLGPDAARVPTRRLPDIAVRLAALRNPVLQQLLGQLGKRVEYSNAAARVVLGWKPRSVETAVVDCGRALLAAREPAMRP